MKLIDKDALVAEIEKLKDTIPYYSTLAEKYAYKEGIEDAMDKIYSLKVKEVDLNFTKEVDVWVMDNEDTSGFFNVQELAKHFFKLGLSVSNKAQKGE